MPREPDISLAIDIGVHAGNEAMRVVWETCDRLQDNGEKVMATAIAAGILKARLAIIIKGSEGLIEGFGDIVGEVARTYEASNSEELIKKATDAAAAVAQNLHPGASTLS